MDREVLSRSERSDDVVAPPPGPDRPRHTRGQPSYRSRITTFPDSSYSPRNSFPDRTSVQSRHHLVWRDAMCIHNLIGTDDPLNFVVRDRLQSRSYSGRRLGLGLKLGYRQRATRRTCICTEGVVGYPTVVIRGTAQTLRSFDRARQEGSVHGTEYMETSTTLPTMYIEAPQYTGALTALAAHTGIVPARSGARSGAQPRVQSKPDPSNSRRSGPRTKIASRGEIEASQFPPARASGRARAGSAARLARRVDSATKLRKWPRSQLGRTRSRHDGPRFEEPVHACQSYKGGFRVDFRVGWVAQAGNQGPDRHEVGSRENSTEGKNLARSNAVVWMSNNLRRSSMRRGTDSPSSAAIAKVAQGAGVFSVGVGVRPGQGRWINDVPSLTNGNYRYCAIVLPLNVLCKGVYAELPYRAGLERRLVTSGMGIHSQSCRANAAMLTASYSRDQVKKRVNVGQNRYEAFEPKLKYRRGSSVIAVRSPPSVSRGNGNRDIYDAEIHAGGPDGAVETLFDVHGRQELGLDTI
ncbi:hypothetical protein LXA43DRAFT_1060833 [Ganoderma leucocontextum]|nr:hypothetical protein LXA43DRAFT_1060833 [Ganoderma leucocontextum]